ITIYIDSQVRHARGIDPDGSAENLRLRHPGRCDFALNCSCRPDTGMRTVENASRWAGQETGCRADRHQAQQGFGEFGKEIFTHGADYQIAGTDTNCLLPGPIDLRAANKGNQPSIPLAFCSFAYSRNFSKPATLAGTG